MISLKRNLIKKKIVQKLIKKFQMETVIKKKI